MATVAQKPASFSDYHVADQDENYMSFSSVMEFLASSYST